MKNIDITQDYVATINTTNFKLVRNLSCSSCNIYTDGEIYVSETLDEDEDKYYYSVVKMLSRGCMHDEILLGYAGSKSIFKKFKGTYELYEDPVEADCTYENDDCYF